jgi:hypothetical protein
MIQLYIAIHAENVMIRCDLNPHLWMWVWKHARKVR